MRRYIIERAIPGLGAMTGAELQEAAARSCAALAKLGTGIQWEHSYITADTMYCSYLADSEAIVKEHARIGQFPATRITPVSRMIDPLTATPRD